MYTILRSVVGIVALSASLSAADIVLIGSNPTPAIGNSFTVTVQASAVPTVTSWNIFLRFDPTKVRLTSQDAATSNAFGMLGPDMRDNTAINASGEVRAQGLALGAGISGGGVLGVFTFSAVGGGSTTIRTEVLSPTSLFGDNFLKGSTITYPNIGAPVTLTISGGAVPNRAIRMKSINSTLWDSLSHGITQDPNPPVGTQIFRLPNTSTAIIFLKQTSAG